MAIIKEEFLEKNSEETQEKIATEPSFEEVEKAKARLFHTQKEAFRVLGIRRSLATAMLILASFIFLAFMPVMNVVTDMQAIVAPEEIAEIEALKEGRITEVKVKEGDFVKKGDLLAKIESPQNDYEIRETEAEIKVFKAQLSSLETKRLYAFERYTGDKRLFEKRVISRDEFQATELAFKTLEEDRKELEAKLEGFEERLRFLKEEKTQGMVRAPFSGKVISDPASKTGGFVTKGEFILALASQSHLIEFMLREEDYGRVEVDDKASVRFYAFPGRHFKGQVVRVKHYAEPLERHGFKTSALKVLIRLEELPEGVRNGMSAKVEIEGRPVSAVDLVRRRV